MTDNNAFEKLLDQSLADNGYHLVRLHPLHSKIDTLVKIKTLEDIMHDLDTQNIKEMQSYVIYIKPQKKVYEIKIPQHPPQIYPAKSILDGIYLSNRKLNIPYLLKNASLLYDTGEYGLARNIYKTLLKSGEASDAALFLIGKCNEAEGHLAEAIKNYEDSLLYNQKLETYQELSKLFINLKKHQEAAELLVKALKLKEINQSIELELLCTIGNCYLRLENFEKSEHYYKKALRLSIRPDEVLCNLGVLYLNYKKIGESKNYFNNACLTNTKNSVALSGLGCCYFEEKNYAQALDYYAKSLTLNLNNIYTLQKIIRCAFLTQNYTRTLELLKNYLQLYPAHLDLTYSLAIFEFHFGKFSDAKVTLENILTVSPDHYEAKELLKKVQQKTT
ncbi:MAG: tetratricopeptide repeat protein [Bdellovibrio sp.]|nr:tetratricopeptide repeat protein [Bdellovibrio sp.]